MQLFERVSVVTACKTRNDYIILLIIITRILSFHLKKYIYPVFRLTIHNIFEFFC